MAAPDTRCKVVVRRLPPSLQEDAFKETVEDWFDRVDWFSYVQGKTSSKELVHSRAYLRFKDAEDVPRFRQAWDGHAFVNERGTQFRCQVEYAPYQKVPRQRVKRDPKEGTLERDADFQAFVEKLKAGPEPAAPAEPAAAADGSSGGSAVIVTPLMQYLKDKRAPEPVIQAVRRGAKAQPVVAAAKGKAAAGGPDKKGKAAASAPDKKGKAAATAAGKKGDAKQQAAVLTVVKQGNAKQQAAAASATAQQGAKKAPSGAARKQPAAGKAEAASPQPGILRRPAAADSAAAMAQAAGTASMEPPQQPQQQQAAAAEGSKKKASGKQPEKAKGKQAPKQAKEPHGPGEKPVLKVLTRPAAVQQQDALAAAAETPSTSSAAAGPSSEEAQKQRPSKAVRPGFGAYQPKAAGRLLQAALPQLGEASSGGGGGVAAPGRGGGSRGRGRGRGRQQAADGGGSGDA